MCWRRYEAIGGLKNGISSCNWSFFMPFSPYPFDNKTESPHAAQAANFLAQAYAQAKNRICVMHILFRKTDCPAIYFLINNDLPVISSGWLIPIISIKVGTMSARQPPSFNVYAGS